MHLITRLSRKVEPNILLASNGMTIETTYTNAKANLAKLCDEVLGNRATVIIHRRGVEDVVLVAADELSGLIETVHLLGSPRNARRLLTALDRATSSQLRNGHVKEYKLDPK